MSVWKPISTVPRNRQKVDVWAVVSADYLRGERYIDCWFDEDRQAMVDRHGNILPVRFDSEDDGGDGIATHWMNAPTPPEIRGPADG